MIAQVGRVAARPIPTSLHYRMAIRLCTSCPDRADTSSAPVQRGQHTRGSDPIMSTDLLITAALIALYFILRNDQLGKRLVMFVLGKAGLEAVGRHALASQPDALTLEPALSAPDPAADEVGQALERRGFIDGGRFAIREMQGVHVRFLTKPDDAIVAVVYEHARAGHWCDLNTAYADDTSFTLSNTHLGGSLDDRPGHPVVRAPRVHPVALLARFMSERPRGTPRRIEAAEAAQYFADAYAESMAWRKNRGVTATEVRGAAHEGMRA